MIFVEGANALYLIPIVLGLFAIGVVLYVLEGK